MAAAKVGCSSCTRSKSQPTRGKLPEQNCQHEVYKWFSGDPGRKFQGGKKTINQRTTLPLECAQGDQPARCPNRIFCVHQPSAFWWLVVFPRCVGGGDAMCGDVVRDVMWLAAR